VVTTSQLAAVLSTRTCGRVERSAICGLPGSARDGRSHHVAELRPSADDSYGFRLRPGVCVEPGPRSVLDDVGLKHTFHGPDEAPVLLYESLVGGLLAPLDGLPGVELVGPAA